MEQSAAFTPQKEAYPNKLIGRQTTLHGVHDSFLCQVSVIMAESDREYACADAAII